MKYLLIFCILLMFSCQTKHKEPKRLPFNTVGVQTIFEDSVSIRAIELLDDGSLAFAGSNGKFGLLNKQSGSWQVGVQEQDSLKPSFRSTAHTATDFFMLSIGSPALLYKTGESGAMELVYREEDSLAFYDAMRFWNNQEGIAIGDPTSDCLSILITRDGGNSWQKLPCSILPKSIAGEAAFAASDTNIAIEGDKTWVLSGGVVSRVFYSPDKGKSWEVITLPILQGVPTQGGYSMDFYDENNGFIIGGDYTQPALNSGNKAKTVDGGKTWQLVAENKEPGYKSCVQYVPNSDGKELIALGFTGISYSSDGGENWSELSKEGFFTLRFVNDSLAYAAGKNRIAKLEFK